MRSFSASVTAVAASPISLAKVSWRLAARSSNARQHLVDERAEAHLGGLDLDLPRVEARQHQQILHQGLHLARPAPTLR